MNKPIIQKKITANVNGNEITVIGETFENPIGSTTAHGNIHSQVRLLNDKDEPVHTGFSYPKQLSEDELEYEVTFHAKNIVEKPKAYGL